ncbi:YihY/virulence factor BrkB family protein [Lyngbya sp. CCY1209]|uniref:YihY/virulence factor BrkB family protein n=1 Tax=Lyngbya sp. CCY1209 TaxID=2886103 RepID=UPI002D20EC47|nr:YihY/virulence factor BrkB family protein [Lyngbya sp. CCY1209]MEB3885353.1 YihY/virulence factor BrkB family protein [Lyngbya sp. CCY1209]
MLLARPFKFLSHLHRAVLHHLFDWRNLERLIEDASEGLATLLFNVLRFLWGSVQTLFRGAKLGQILHPERLYRRFEWGAEKVADGVVILLKSLWWIGRQIKKRIVHFFLFFTYLNWTTIHRLGVYVLRHRLPGLSAEMAFNSTLALVPAVLAVFAAIGAYESLQSTLLEMASLLGEVVPEEVQKLIGTTLDQAGTGMSSKAFSFSFIISVWLFSGVIGSAMAALNQIHQVPPNRRRPFWKAKLIAIALTFGTLFLLIMACAAIFISDAMMEILARKSCILETVGNCPLDQINTCLYKPPVQDCLLRSTLLDTWKRLRWPITLGIVSTNFALIYRYGPSFRKPNTPLIPGAILAAIFWALISNLFRWYVYQTEYYNIYGALGTFIVLLLWLNISCLVMLFGAQLNFTVGEEIRHKEALLLAERVEKSRLGNS